PRLSTDPTKCSGPLGGRWCHQGFQDAAQVPDSGDTRQGQGSGRQPSPRLLRSERPRARFLDPFNWPRTGASPVQNLTRAQKELFRRTPDETFESLSDLWQHCHAQRERSTDRWRPPQTLRPVAEAGRLILDLGDGNEPFRLNDWSFTQL